ncbi:MAG: hypothetical protein EOM59_13600 [Clostridia bacterium]|nr:hypothetical protein [Clostridia bacterium]
MTTMDYGKICKFFRFCNHCSQDEFKAMYHHCGISDFGPFVSVQWGMFKNNYLSWSCTLDDGTLKKFMEYACK